MLNLKIPNTLNRIQWTRVNGKIVRKITLPKKEETTMQKLINYLSNDKTYNPLTDPNALEYRKFNDFLERKVDYASLTQKEKQDFLFELKKMKTPIEIASGINELKPVFEEFAKMLERAKKPEMIVTDPDEILLYKSFHDSLHEFPGFEDLYLENADQLKVVNAILNSDLDEAEKIKALSDFSFIDYKPVFKYDPVETTTIEFTTPTKVEKFTQKKRYQIIEEVFKDKAKSDFFINELNDLPVVEQNYIVATIQASNVSKDVINESFVNQNFKNQWGEFSDVIEKHRIPYKYQELYENNTSDIFRNEVLGFFIAFIRKCFEDKLRYLVYSDYNKEPGIKNSKGLLLTAQRFCSYVLIENGLKISWTEAGKNKKIVTRDYTYEDLIMRSTHLVFLKPVEDDEIDLFNSFPSMVLQKLINKECSLRASLEIDIEILKNIINTKISAPAA